MDLENIQSDAGVFRNVSTSCLMCVVAVSGCQAVWAYVRIGRMYCLYVVEMSSLECPYVVCVRARMTFSRVLAFVFDCVSALFERHPSVE